MNEQLKRYINPIINFWKNLTKKKKIIIISVAGGILALAIIIEILLSLPSYVILYPGLDKSESVEVMNELRERGISYKENNGTISVPKNKENALRMELANEGYPKSTLNYDFFTKNVDVMSTDYEKKIIERYQLNQRLESVVKTFECIKDATVTINVPESNTYAWDNDSKKSTASVTVTLASGKELEPTQVNGIKQLISKSVPDLNTDDVAVINTATGKELDAKSAGTAVDISEFKLSIEKEYENDIAASVLKVLRPIFGENNVQVTAKSIMDIDKNIKEIITYKPSDDQNTGVISESHENKEQEKGDKNNGGTPGAESNTESPNYAGVTVEDDTIYIKDDKTYKYLVSQAKEQIQSDAASVKDMTISVVVNQQAMSDDQRTKISELVAHAAAILPEKVAVYNTQFAINDIDVGTQPKTTKAINPIVMAVGAAITGLLLILLMLFLLMSRARKKKLKKLLAERALEAEQSENNQDNNVEEEDAAKERKTLEAMHVAQKSREEDLRNNLQDFTSQNPEIVAQLIRNWVRGDDEDDG